MNHHQLSPDQLQRLKEHQYRSQGTSLSEVFMQPYWRWLVTKVPLWVAPNLITFVGLVMNLFTTVLVVLFDLNSEGAVSVCVTQLRGSCVCSQLDGAVVIWFMIIRILVRSPLIVRGGNQITWCGAKVVLVSFPGHIFVPANSGQQSEHETKVMAQGWAGEQAFWYCMFQLIWATV